VPWPNWSFDQVMTNRPAIRVNQLGYLPGRPMQATLVSAAEHSVEFVVRDRHGVVILTGRSQPWPVRPEPTSGLSVHRLDFTGLRARGAGFRLEAAGQQSHPFVIGDDLYRMLSVDALRFFARAREPRIVARKDALLPNRALRRQIPNGAVRRSKIWTDARLCIRLR
jgi:endoglucanase